MTPAVVWIWGVTLVLVTLVIVPLAIYLLHRTLRAAMAIERNTREALDAGARIAENTAAVAQNTKVPAVNTTIIPNKNTRVTTNTVNANTNVSNAFPDLTNTVLNSGDYLKITPVTQTALDAAQKLDLERLVDPAASVDDQFRQRDLISIKYNLKAYASVEGSFPTTGGVATKIEGKADEKLYTAMKDFYGGTYNLKIDPASPTYYYGYLSDGTTFTLTGYLIGQKKAFTLTDAS